MDLGLEYARSSACTQDKLDLAAVNRMYAEMRAEAARDFARIGEHDIVFTTYPLLWRDVEALQAQAWHLLILDEAQMVKNAASRAAAASPTSRAPLPSRRLRSPPRRRRAPTAPST